MPRTDDNLLASKQASVARLRSFVNPFFVNHTENTAAYYPILWVWYAVFLRLLSGEAVCQWSVSESRVHKLCQAGRILDLERLGRLWVIPENAEKSNDPRNGNRTSGKTEEDK